EGREDPQEDHRRSQDQEGRVLRFVHLQGVEAGPPQHRHLQERHVHPELVHQRHLR
ncbi:hypothetical protein B484DRAFT_310742, partial [Ochromonadaceae sp. CCMP2298]